MNEDLAFKKARKLSESIAEDYKEFDKLSWYKKLFMRGKLERKIQDKTNKIRYLNNLW